MRSVGVGALFAIAALLCATPLSLRWSHGNEQSLSVAVDSADAAELNLAPGGRSGVVILPPTTAAFMIPIAAVRMLGADGMVARITEAHGWTFVAMALCIKRGERHILVEWPWPSEPPYSSQCLLQLLGPPSHPTSAWPSHALIGEAVLGHLVGAIDVT